jgi:hypothetical protein
VAWPFFLHLIVVVQECVAAGKTFLSALKIFAATHGDRHLSVVLALDKLGMAACKTNTNLELAVAALQDAAFQIRCELLGLEHLDTVDTLNNIAGVSFNLKQYDLAAKDYYAVLAHRVDLFGQNHINVAATAFKVAWILESSGILLTFSASVSSVRLGKDASGKNYSGLLVFSRGARELTRKSQHGRSRRWDSVVSAP